MEKRLLYAIVLSFLVLIGYQALFVKKQPPAQTKAVPMAEREKGVVQEPTEKAVPLPSTPSPSEKQPEQEMSYEYEKVEAQREEQVMVDTSLYRAVWNNRGAALVSWKLKDYKDENKDDLDLVSVRSTDLNIFPFFIVTDDPEFDRIINNSLYKASRVNLELKAGETGALRFEYADEQGTRVEKIFTFRDGQYDIDLDISVWKNGQKLEPSLIWGPGIGNPSLEDQKKRFGGGAGVAVFVSDKVHRMEERKFKPELSAFNFVSWAAYEDNYFTAVFMPPSVRGTAVFMRGEKEQSPYFYLSVATPAKAYIGPKKLDYLDEFGYKTKKLIKFGFFGAIAEILLRAIKLIHKAFPNWGISIIILTFIIKVIFFPLTYSSTKSMSRMQELQPKIKALRAKYKKAKQDIAQRRQMNEEMMRLYKEHGINPAGGCLPMLVQIPVFWGFFRMLVVAIEFRHSPFVFWIQDLSVRDPYYVTPIMMGVTQFISQKMTPTSADPSQAKIMLIMPVVMTLFFMSFQSGLVLYWLTNNVLQIGQQYIMNRMMKKQKREPHGKRRKK